MAERKRNGNGKPVEQEPEPEPETPHLNLLRAMTLVSHPTETTLEKSLVVQIDIRCSHCEVALSFIVPGHHIPGVLVALEKARADYPELCTTHSGGAIVKVDRKKVM